MNVLNSIMSYFVLDNGNIDYRAFIITRIGNSVAVIQINYRGFVSVSLLNAVGCLYR